VITSGRPVEKVDRVVENLTRRVLAKRFIEREQIRIDVQALELGGADRDHAGDRGRLNVGLEVIAAGEVDVADAVGGGVGAAEVAEVEALVRVGALPCGEGGEVLAPVRGWSRLAGPRRRPSPPPLY
jgi:hypothetical protein